jgi:hypothetical protein
MNEPSFDADTTERILRGEPTRPSKLAELLTAATSELTTEDLSGEETAVAAFLEARSLHPGELRLRRLSALVSLKGALIGMLLLLAGGTTLATTSQHLPGPFGNEHPHSTRTPTVSPTAVPHLPPRTPSRPTPEPHDKHGTHPADSTHPGTPHVTHHPRSPTQPTHQPTAAHPKNSHMPPRRR